MSDELENAITLFLSGESNRPKARKLFGANAGAIIQEIRTLQQQLANAEDTANIELERSIELSKQLAEVSAERDHWSRQAVLAASELHVLQEVGESLVAWWLNNDDKWLQGLSSELPLPKAQMDALASALRTEQQDDAINITPERVEESGNIQHEQG